MERRREALAEIWRPRLLEAVCFSGESSAPRTGSAYEKFMLRDASALAVVGVAALALGHLDSFDDFSSWRALLVLVLAGTGALQLSLPIAIAIASLLAVVGSSYYQTIHGYPSGGGAYIVAYDNLGVPKNPDNPFYTLSPEHNPDGANWVDLGLGGVLGDAAENGKFKVPTLRNIANTAPYMHNGVLGSLEQVVHFYNTRDVKEECPNPLTTMEDALALDCWPAPEIATRSGSPSPSISATLASMELRFVFTISGRWDAETSVHRMPP